MPQKDYGKNIRVSTESWYRIKKFCAVKGIKIGKFTEECTVEAIKNHKKLTGKPKTE